MRIKNCWVTALEIKELITKHKKETSGRESVLARYKPWPFPRAKDFNNEK